MAHYRYNGQDDLGKVIEDHMQRGDHIVRLYVTNTRTSRSTLLCFYVNSTDGKSIEGTTEAPDDSNTDIEAGRHVTINFDATPTEILVF